MNILKPFKHRGVFYPIQTFTKEKAIDFKTIPIALESSEETSKIILEKLAFSLSDKVQYINSHQRKVIHLAGSHWTA
jgi:hypothetical protein